MLSAKVRQFSGVEKKKGKSAQKKMKKIKELRIAFELGVSD